MFRAGIVDLILTPSSLSHFLRVYNHLEWIYVKSKEEFVFVLDGLCIGFVIESLYLASIWASHS